ncbi:MAG TPA: hypothetical protein VME18_12085 [Acidobacteriaceae bacterium]|nr:hypothetical protein [Acidobacteriaceae bacterium]
MPAQTVMGGTSFSTTLQAPAAAPQPTVTPGATKTRVASHTSGSIAMGFATMSKVGRVESWPAPVR